MHIHIESQAIFRNYTIIIPNIGSGFKAPSLLLFHCSVPAAQLLTAGRHEDYIIF